MKTTALVLFGTVLVLAASAAAMAEPDTPEPTATVVAHMHEHLAAVNKIKAAVIRGDLKATREPARWLAEHPIPADIPAGWDAHLEGMRLAARAALNAHDFPAAAAAASQMAEACGSCHVANGVADRFADRNAPADNLGSMAHMLRHQWAADRMWEGLIGPSDLAWGQGTDLLLETPLSAHEMRTEDDSTRSIRRMARRVHELAAHGMLEQDPTARADIFAEFLANCAACHTRLGQGPRR